MKQWFFRNGTTTSIGLDPERKEQTRLSVPILHPGGKSQAVVEEG